MFNVGDKIVYPMHGAGRIDAIEEKNILGENQSYYILKMPGEVKVMVPIDKAEQIGVRNIIDKEEAGKVMAVLEENETAMSDKWNKRYRDNMDKMKSGDIYEVADVVRNLSFKQKEKGLSTGEKKMLSNAKQILVSELVLAEQASQDEIENLVNNKIELSFEENKLPQEEVDLNKNVVSKFIPMYNEDISQKDTQEADTQGGTRKVVETDTKKEIVYDEKSGTKTIITQSIVSPKIEGAIITAEGGNNTNTKANIIQAVEAVTGLPTHKIQVFEMKKTN